MPRLPPELIRSVETLNDLTPEQVDEARRLAPEGKGLAASYLQQLVVRCHLKWAADFIDEVLLVSAHVDVRTWGIYDALCVPQLWNEQQWNELLLQPLSTTLAVVETIEGKGLVRQVPRMSGWDHESFCGGPGVVVRAKPYWWRPPESITWTSEIGDVEPITNIEVAGRRWIASRLAWKWKFTGRPLPATPADVAAALELKAPMSRDGEIAVSGLIREQEMTGREEMAPGFRGPDEWYA